jgi:hypothetical protein
MQNSSLARTRAWQQNIMKDSAFSHFYSRLRSYRPCSDLRQYDPRKPRRSFLALDETAENVPFSGTQHVASFTSEYTNLNASPINATAPFYDVPPATGLAGSFLATIPLNNLPVGQFQFRRQRLS